MSGGWKYVGNALVDLYETCFVDAHDRAEVEKLIAANILAHGDNTMAMDALRLALENKYPDYLPILEKLLLLR